MNLDQCWSFVHIVLILGGGGGEHGLWLKPQADDFQRLLSCFLPHERNEISLPNRINVQFIIIFQILKWHFFQWLAVYL